MPYARTPWTPILALRELGIAHEHLFSNEVDENALLSSRLLVWVEAPRPTSGFYFVIVGVKLSAHVKGATKNVVCLDLVRFEPGGQGT